MIKVSLMKPKFKVGRLVITVVIIVLIINVLLFSRPVPAVKPQLFNLQASSGQAIPLTWPSEGQSAIGAVGFGVLATHNDQKAVPIASVAKVLTALMVLNQKPLKLGEQGPLITITEKDVTSYQNFVAQDGSVVPVAVGEQISEYQALQALLLPSSNNMAYTLTNWAFGSSDVYLKQANLFASQKGLVGTFISDPSGFSEQTVSTAQDLVVLAEMALNNPVFKQIVGQAQAQIPVAGTIRNTNFLLGTDNIIGIKTGHTDQAGGCYLFAFDHNVSGQIVTIVGAVIGSPSIEKAMADSVALIHTSQNGFTTVNVASQTTPVGYYQAAWGNDAEIVPKSAIQVLAWKGSPIDIATKAKNIKKSAAKDSVVGTLSVTTNQKTNNVTLELKQPMAAPSLAWRLFH
jgi:D-alanyl-D-alanine carboxypeptidase (penicillin-binding protein 5/6)